MIATETLKRKPGRFLEIRILTSPRDKKGFLGTIRR